MEQMKYGSSCSYTVISGIIGEDVILPCTVTYKEDFSYDALTILWSTNDVRVHQFFYDKFHRHLQNKIFKERTHLFYEEFPKGNMSLLLKNIQSSDAGIYECLVFLKEYTYIFKTHMELVVQDKIYAYSNESSAINLSVWVLFTCSIAVLCVLLRRRKRSRGRTGILLSNRLQETEKTL
ncbi:CD276 antigen homolog [Mixophyes fleayi]|uniref:CD276 antigen homolog n=1 Tax=Mixophyes fleayi TaxID=3061075 RepID=UPI003F4E0992